MVNSEKRKFNVFNNLFMNSKSLTVNCVRHHKYFEKVAKTNKQRDAPKDFTIGLCI